MQPRLTWIARKVIGTVGGRTVVVVLLFILVYQVWLSVAALGKVADGVGAELDPRGRFAVDVVFGFEPQRFHVLELQDFGRVRGTTGNILHLHSVTQDAVSALARKYWIQEIRPSQN